MLDTRRDRGEHRHQLGLEGLLQMVYAECQFVGAELLLLSEARDIGARYLVPNEVLARQTDDENNPENCNSDRTQRGRYREHGGGGKCRQWRIRSKFGCSCWRSRWV